MGMNKLKNINNNLVKTGLNRSLLLRILLLSSILSACGGGGTEDVGNGGNETSDTIAPVITLSGSATISLNQGETYTDAGATADDETDGDISTNISVGGDTVDTATVGSYSITYNVSDAAGNIAIQVTRTVNVNATSIVSTYFMPAVNDTGSQIGGNYPSGNNADCSGETITEQDCSFGRDKQAADGNLVRVGDGQAGFDFTKLGVDGTPLAIQNQAWSDIGSEAVGTQWSCVKDNHTNLIWEVKINTVQGGGLHSKEDLFFWYSTDTTNNGGLTGIEKHTNGTSTCTDQIQNDSSTFCNTQAFVGRVNAENFCGSNDWRLPNIHELISIAHYNKSTSPAIDTDFFPNTELSYLPSIQRYTTSTSWVMAFSGDNYLVVYDDGGTRKDLRNQAFSARLVRTAP